MPPGPTAVRGLFDTLPDLMDTAAEQIGDREAWVDGEERLSFAGWVEAADRVAATMAGLGVRHGDVVALYLANSIDYAVGYTAAARLGAVTTGINPRLGPVEVGAIMRTARPALVVRDDKLGMPAVDRSIPVLERTELAAVAAARSDSGGQGYRRPGRLDSSDPVTIIWTSGTTGTPKGAWFDHRNLAAAVTSAGAMTEPFDRRLGAVPMSHAGFMAKLWEQFAMAVTIVLIPSPFAAAEMFRVMTDERITVGAGVPTQWAKVLELPGVDRADWSALRVCLVATAPAPPELVERMRTAFRCPVVVRYAMTESPSITGTDPTDPPQVQYRTVGRAQAGVELAVVDADRHAVRAGDVGRVRVRGACVMRGYWGDPDRTAEVLDGDGWLTSTDLGRLDADGNLELVGRVGDMYIRGGYNVYPTEVAFELAEHPAVAQVAVVGTPAPAIGEIGVAFVVPVDADEPPTLDELRTWVTARLADYKAPDRLVITDALPLTPGLKIDTAELRRLARGSNG